MTTRLTQLVSLGVFFFFVAFPAHAEIEKTLVFVTADSASNVINAYHDFLKLVYGEVGYDIRVARLPTKRSYVHADVEKADGIVISTESLLKDYTNMIMVPVPLRQVELVVFSSTREFTVEGAASLRPYRVGLMRGYFLSEEITRDMDRIIVEDYDALFSILQVGRVDVALALKGEGRRFLKRHPRFQGFKVLEPPLFSATMYHFLNKKHESLIPKIIPVMERLIHDHVFEKLYAPYEN